MMRIFLFLVFTFLLKNSSQLQCQGKNGKETECQDQELCHLTSANETGCKRAISCSDQSPTCTHVRAGYAECCCHQPMCNKLEKSTHDNTTTIIIVFATLIVVGIIGIVIFIIVHRIRKKKREKLAEARAAEFHPGSATTPATEEGHLIAYEDCTNEQVQPVLTGEEKEDLISSIYNQEPIPGEDDFEKKVKLTKLVTYGTTDNITLMEEFVPLAAVSGDDDFTFCQNMLAELVNHGPREFGFDTAALKRVLNAAANVFKEESTLLEIQVPCIVYGDIHGQYSDLIRWLNLNGWPSQTRCVFLGDFVDRGSHGVEVIAMMSCLKVVFPNNIFVCRGNHEEESLNKAYSFYAEVRQRFHSEPAQDHVYDYFKKVFMHLPLATLIGGRILGMHGGISPKLNSLQDIREIKRPIADFVVGSLACDLVWSDPDVTAGDMLYRPNYEREPNAGIGQLFSAEAVIAMCEKLNVDLIIRGHQAPLHGYAQWARGHLITLFSAPGYKGTTTKTVNMGACIECPVSGDLIIKQIKVSAEFRKKRIEDVEKRAKDLRSFSTVST